MCPLEGEENKAFLTNLGAVLLQMNQVTDCEEAIKKMSAHVEGLNLEDPKAKIYTFVNKRDVQSAIL